MTGKNAVKIVGGFLLALWCSLGVVKAQLIPPDPFYELNSWEFQAPDWLADAGDAPLGFTNLNNPVSFDGNSVQVDAPSNAPAFLNYPIKDSLSTNLMFTECSIEVWVLPDWNTGTGPGGWGRLIEVGAYGTNSPSSWFSLYFSPDGSSLNFSSETNGVFTNYLSAPIAWDTNTWHLVDLTFNHFRSQLYLDGQLATNGPGVFYEPSAEVISNGFFIGSASGGDPSTQARAQFDDLATYSYALSAYEVTNDYATGLQAMGWGGFHPADGSPDFPGGGGGTNGGYSGYTNSPPSYGTNLWIAGENISSNYLFAIASNTLADVAYEIQSWTDLTQPTNWVSQGFFLGSETTNWTPLLPLAVSKTNNFFIGLRSWADDGSGLPLWWQLQYFGHVGVDPNADPAGDGWSNIQNFELGRNPNAFYTPQAPQNFTTSYNLNTSTETVSWSPSPGPVTRYILTINNEQTGQITNITLSATNTSFSQSLVASSPDFDNPPFGPQINVFYGLHSMYGTNGSSVAGSLLSEGDIAPSAQLINGAQGRLYYVFQGLPNDLSALRIYRQQEQVQPTALDYYGVDGPYAEDDLLQDFIDSPIDDGYFEISAASITNGVCELPDAQVPPYFAYNFWVQTVRSNGVSSAWAASTPVDYGAFSTSLPFVDARRQLKDNLIFSLRAATASGPFAFTVNEGEENHYLPSVFTWPNNYVYADFYVDIGDNVYAIDELRPLHDNYFYSNFLFDPSKLTSDGFLNTGCYEATNGPDISIANYPSNYFNTATFISNTNSAVPSSKLTADLSEWILPDNGAAQSFTGTWFAPGQTNVYGLPYLSEVIAWVTNGTVVEQAFAPGDTQPSGVNGVSYFDMAQPRFQPNGYYFARFGIDPLPEQSGFSPTSAPPTMLVGVGQSLTVAGYANLAVTNGYPGVDGYLGQYFDAAYQIGTNGDVTANSAGVVSPYGVFTPTVPGPAALITMPDIDPPYEKGTCDVYAVSLQLDANHDGKMDSSYGGTDATSQQNPMRMWVNNNYDRTNLSDGQIVADDLNQISLLKLPAYQQVPDCNYVNESGERVIPCTRDLADFARLWAGGITPELIAALPSGSTITLGWGSVTASSPTIDLFAADNPGIGYQTNETVALQQIDPTQCPYLGRLSPTNVIRFTKSTWPTNEFIWCGVNYGAGGLTMTIADANSNILAQTTAYIQLVDIKQMYERWTVGDNLNFTPMTNSVLATDFLAPGASPFQYTPPQIANTPYILFIHGWNMTSWEKDRFAETAFRRLYWQGYQGRFGVFKWPTGNGIGSITSAVINHRNFDSSESNAWGSATGLLNKLNDLNAQYPGNVYLMAHSMGNVVAGEALRLTGDNQVVNTYIAMQGAISAHCYDPSTPSRWTTGVPDFYANYYTNGQPCYFNASAGAETYINFYNTNDYALNLWNSDQDLKPDFGYGYDSYDNSFTFGIAPIVTLYFPASTYRIFAFGAPARSYALGAQPNVNGVFKGAQINLQNIWPPDPFPADLNLPYGAHYWHSAEFRGDYPQQVSFWQTVLGVNGFNLN